MRFTTLLAASLALVAATAAQASDGEQRFTHEGATYVYSSVVDNGRTVITGRQLPSGDAFRLVVDGKRVTGTSAGQPVAFRTSAARGAAGNVAITTN